MIHAFPRKHMLAASAVGVFLIIILSISPSAKVNATKTVIPLQIEETVPSTDLQTEVDNALVLPDSSNETSTQIAESELPSEPEITRQENWQAFEVKSGHTLSLLFKKAGLTDKDMYKVLFSAKENKSLSKIYPGELLSFLKNDEGQLTEITQQKSPLESYSFKLDENGSYIKTHQTLEPDINVSYASGEIESSLFLAGQKAGLSQAQIMELANIFGWDIDFILDIRSGDRFSLVYEELYLNGEKLKNGRILAASFTNQGRQIDAVLYKQSDGFSNYYTPEGQSMRKAFIRTPVDFARISSHFNLKRKHPILHKIRAHRGTDYAASRGTPIKATGDGKVIHASWKGGYGKTVIIQHGQKITTLYAHMHKYAKGVRTGKRVKQGQVIGYVGTTGRSTGPHLHYEFRVNGVHKNPVKVKLPQANPIPRKEMAAFKSQTETYLAQLRTFTESYQIASSN